MWYKNDRFFCHLSGNYCILQRGTETGGFKLEGGRNEIVSGLTLC